MPRSHDESDEPVDVISAIVTEVADAENADPGELTPRLADAIDPDALEELLRHSDAGVSVTFEYSGHEIRVSADGTITLADSPGNE